MGRHCCCGAKVSANGICSCDYSGWTLIASQYDLPKVDGIYLTRYTDNGGDRHEKPQRFSAKPIRIDTNYCNNACPIHWQLESWDDNVVTHWKELPEDQKR